MEVGIGHHGEPGIEVVPLQSANHIAEIMVENVLHDLPFASGDETVVLISGLGATPVMELYILYNKVYDLLRDVGINVQLAYVGNYFTSLEMGGATLTVMQLDEELRECMYYPCDSMGLTQFKK